MFVELKNNFNLAKELKNKQTMTTLEKFNNAIDYLTKENVALANKAIKMAVSKAFTNEQWLSLTPKQQSMFRVQIIGHLAIEMAFEK